MKIMAGRVIGLCAILVISWQAWTHWNRVTPTALVAPAAKTDEQPSSYAEQELAKKSVTVWGPLADYLKPETAPNSEGEQAVSDEIVESDHVGPSPVGTRTVVLRQSFLLTREVNRSFELPAHAFSPQLHGHYRSFPQGGDKASAEPTLVQLLLLDEKQYARWLSGGSVEALFSADASEDQEIHFSLPATFGQPVKYHLVFRNDSGAAKTIVQADFQIEY